MKKYIILLILLTFISLSNQQIIRANTITTSTVAATICPGSTPTVNWTFTGTFTSGNVFTVQLSSANGFFSSPTTIGTITSTSDSSLTVTIPNNPAQGTGYRIRVIASTPSTTGSDNGSNIFIPVIGIDVPTHFNHTFELCNGSTNAQINTNLAGGTSPYTYIWSPGGATTATISGLAAGNYSITVTDANGCTRSQTATIGQPSVILMAAPTHYSQVNVSCYNGSNGQINVNPGGGTPPYSYSWSPSGLGTNATISNLTAGGYTITVTDNNGCTKSWAATLTQPSDILTSSPSHFGHVDVTVCYGNSNGKVGSAISGGTTPYTYTWSPNMGTTATITNVTAGTYNVTFTDALGCTKTQSATLSQPTQVNPNLSQTNNNCYGNTNGVIRTNASGGSSPYTYAWGSIAGTTATVSNLASGNYTATVTDHNSCTVTATTTILPPVLTVVITSQKNVSCHGGSDGAVTVDGSGGTSGYTFYWGIALGTSSTISGLTAGGYIVIITDAHGCTASSTITITQPAAVLSASFPGGSWINERCNTSYNGMAIATVTGGTTPYSYLWDSAAWSQTSDTAIRLFAGTYMITVSDDHGCTDTASVTLTEPSDVTLTLSASSNVSTFNGSDGSFSVTASGGTSPYVYYYYTNNGADSTGDSGLKAGNYDIYAVDAHGCFAILGDTITQPDPPDPAIYSYCLGSCNTFGHGVIQLPDNSGFLIAGTFQPNPDSSTCTSGLGAKDMLLIKLDSNYTQLWAKEYGTVLDDEANAVSIGADGNYLLSGFSTDSATGYKKLYYVKTDTAGNVIWSKKILDTLGDAVINAANATVDSCYILSGYYSDSSGTGINKEMLLKKIDSAGNTIWTKKFGNNGVDNICYSVFQTKNNDYLLAGNTTGSDSLPKFFVLRTDLSGDSLWAITQGDSGKSYIAKSIVEDKSQNIIFGGEIDTSTSKSAYFSELTAYGEINFAKTYINAAANMIVTPKNGGIVFGGTSYAIAGSPPSVLVQYCDNYGDSLSCATFSGSHAEIGANGICITNNNGVAMTGTVQNSTHSYCASLSVVNITTQGTYYERAIRIHSISRNSDDDLFLLKVFDWDNLNFNSSSLNTNTIYYPASEQYNLFKYLRNNHFTKLILDGLSHSPGNTNPCGYYAGHTSLLNVDFQGNFTNAWVNNNHSFYNDGLLNQSISGHEIFPKCLAKFISLFKGSYAYGMGKVYASISELGERVNGGKMACENDMRNIANFNLTCFPITQIPRPDLAKIDGFWLNYEFWDQGTVEGYCKNCCDVDYNCSSTHCGCPDDTNSFFGPFKANSDGYRNKDNVPVHFGALGGAFSEWGYAQFQAIITYAHSLVAEVNNDPIYTSTYCPGSQHILPAPMKEIEVCITAGLKFNVVESIKDDDGNPHTIPPLDLTTQTISYGGYTYTGLDPDIGSISQALIFAKWLENHVIVGNISIDLTYPDGRGIPVTNYFCPTQSDHDNCVILEPDYFLNNQVDNTPNVTHCSNVTNEPNHFFVDAIRQYCMDILGSFSDGSVPICPHFSVENINLNSLNAMSNFMTSDIQTINNSNAHNNCTGIYQRNRSLPYIHLQYKNQFNASWKESFRQDVGGNPLYQENTLTFSPFSISNDYFKHSQTQDNTNTTPAWGGSASGPNLITIGSREWFPINSYPLVMDHWHNYYLTYYNTNDNTNYYHQSCFNIKYPYDPITTNCPGNITTYCQPPILAFPDRTNIENRDDDYGPDNVTLSASAYGGGHRIKNPNSNLEKDTASKPNLLANMYPNPSTGNFNLSYNLPCGKAELTIYDISGRKLFSKEILGLTGIEKIKLLYLNNGIYYWKLVDQNRSSVNGRLTILK